MNASALDTSFMTSAPFNNHGHSYDVFLVDDQTSTLLHSLCPAIVEPIRAFDVFKNLLDKEAEMKNAKGFFKSAVDIFLPHCVAQKQNERDIFFHQVRFDYILLKIGFLRYLPIEAQTLARSITDLFSIFLYMAYTEMGATALKDALNRLLQPISSALEAENNSPSAALSQTSGGSVLTSQTRPGASNHGKSPSDVLDGFEDIDFVPSTISSAVAIVNKTMSSIGELYGILRKGRIPESKKHLDNMHVTLFTKIPVLDQLALPVTKDGACGRVNNLVGMEKPCQVFNKEGPARATDPRRRPCARQPSQRPTPYTAQPQQHLPDDLSHASKSDSPLAMPVISPISSSLSIPALRLSATPSSKIRRTLAQNPDSTSTPTVPDATKKHEESICWFASAGSLPAPIVTGKPPSPVLVPANWTPVSSPELPTASCLPLLGATSQTFKMPAPIPASESDDSELQTKSITGCSPLLMPQAQQSSLSTLPRALSLTTSTTVLPHAMDSATALSANRTNKTNPEGTQTTSKKRSRNDSDNFFPDRIPLRRPFNIIPSRR